MLSHERKGDFWRSAEHAQASKKEKELADKSSDKSTTDLINHPFHIKDPVVAISF